MARLNWDRESRLRRLVESRGSVDGEGSRPDPAWAPNLDRAPRRTAPAVFKLSTAEVAGLSDKQIRALARIAESLAAARQPKRRTGTKAAVRREEAARTQAQALARALRASGKARVASKILTPLVSGDGSPRGAICRVCRTELSRADVAARRARHLECS